MKRSIKLEKEALEEELDYDYEQDFQDDDGMMDLGIEDEEESKEAQQRTFGSAAKRANFENIDFDEKTTGTSQTGKQIQKTLRNVEKNDLYDSEEEDPYATDMEEEEEEVQPENDTEKKDASPKTKPAGMSPGYFKSKSPAAILEVIKKQSMDARKKRESSAPLPKRETSASPPYVPKQSSYNEPEIKIKFKVGTPLSSESKRKREDENGSDFKKTRTKMDSPIPPPPTAAQVLAKVKNSRPATSPIARVSHTPIQGIGSDESNLTQKY